MYDYAVHFAARTIMEEAFSPQPHRHLASLYTLHTLATISYSVHIVRIVTSSMSSKALTTNQSILHERTSLLGGYLIHSYHLYTTISHLALSKRIRRQYIRIITIRLTLFYFDFVAIRSWLVDRFPDPNRAVQPCACDQAL
jgi:hypothetical protein